MSPHAHIIDELIQENKKLREALSVAEQWIGREVSEMRLRKTKEETMKRTRLDLAESEAEIRERLDKYFSEYNDLLSEENRTLLVESELNFYHIVRKKDLDGLMVTNIYQKILENIFEEHWTKHFRTKHKKTRLHPRKNDLLEKTLYKVIHDDFRLSLGKIYQICVRMIEGGSHELMELFKTSVETLPLYQAMNDGEFWEFFKDIIETHAFGEKRHAGKISFQDVQFIRESMTGNYEQDGLIKVILKYLQ